MITGGVCSAYGLRTWGHLFTSRQLVALTTFSDLVQDSRERVREDAASMGLPTDNRPLAESDMGVVGYADAVVTYLGFGVSKAADYNGNLVSWITPRNQARNTFSKQALPMVWDFCEVNPFAGA